MKYTLDHLEPGDIPRKQRIIKEKYSEINEIMLKSKQSDLTQEDKKQYYTALGIIRYEKWALRENISKRSCRKMFDGLWRTVVFDGEINILNVELGRVLSSCELRDKKDEAWEQFLARQIQLNEGSKSKNPKLKNN